MKSELAVTGIRDEIEMGSKKESSEGGDRHGGTRMFIQTFVQVLLKSEKKWLI